MRLFTLTELSDIFAEVDNITSEYMGAYHKEVRNLCQRLHVPPSDQHSRLFYYSTPRAMTIRVLQLLHRMGVNRPLLMKVCETMTSMRTGSSLEDLEFKFVREHGFDHALTITWSGCEPVIGISVSSKNLDGSLCSATTIVPLVPIVRALPKVPKPFPDHASISRLSEVYRIGRTQVMRLLEDVTPSHISPAGRTLYPVTKVHSILTAYNKREAELEAQRIERQARVQMTLGGVAVPYLPTTAKLNFQKPSEGM